MTPRPWPAPRPLVARYGGMAAFALALFIVALVPRAVGADLFPTQDEDYWLHRSAAFRLALERGDWPDTYRSGHPGVTTMWLASIGARPWAEALTRFDQDNVFKLPEFMAALAAARRPILAFNALLVAALGLLAWRLFGPGPALLGGALLALDPFLVAHAQQVHLDALLAGFVALALLSALVRWTAGGGRGFLLLCGLASGLAFLTKAPSAFLVAAVPLIALIGRQPWRPGSSPARLAFELLCWAALAGATALLLWPALLANPFETLGQMARFTAATSQRAREANNFLLGQPLADPGPLFYPLTLLFRLTPAALVGLATLLAVRPPAPLRTPIALLLTCSLAFLLMLLLGPKKFDRYMLPSIVLLDLLAGLGLWLALVWRAGERESGGAGEEAPRTRGDAQTPERSPALRLSRSPALLAALAAIAWPLLTVAPYHLAYYNPLLGGGPAAVRVVPVGRGEGFDRIAAFLNRQPNAAEARIAIFFEFCATFHTLLDGTALRSDRPPGATYYVEYVNARQRRRPARLPLVQPPLERVWLNGIEYARIYRVRGPADSTRTAPCESPARAREREE